MESVPSQLDAFRYEVLPFGKVEEEAAGLLTPRTLTVTCSPKHGPNRTVEVAGRLRALGHVVIGHIAARMVRGPEHLHELLSAMAAAGIDDAFVVGGDASDPAGPYDSALELVQAIRGHDLAPRTIGVTAYPEGHPFIPEEVLEQDLLHKDGLADYMATQMCFDARVIVGWLERTRAAGVHLPAYLGVPGLVDSRRLLEISARVGVGTSISYIRKQHGILSLLHRRRKASERLISALVPQIGGDLGVAGIHFFTFNRLIETARFADPWEGAQAAGQRPLADSLSAAIELER